jgi:hypothetical protein
MSFISKSELKKQLKDLGIKVEGNSIRKKDLIAIASSGYSRKFDAIEKDLRSMNDLVDEIVYMATNEEPGAYEEITHTAELLKKGFEKLKPSVKKVRDLIEYSISQVD